MVYEAITFKARSGLSTMIWESVLDEEDILDEDWIETGKENQQSQKNVSQEIENRRS